MIADLCVKHDTLCFSDEVYEWLVYRGHQHIKIGTVLVYASMLVYSKSFIRRLQVKENLRSGNLVTQVTASTRKKPPIGSGIFRYHASISILFDKPTYLPLISYHKHCNNLIWEGADC